MLTATKEPTVIERLQTQRLSMVDAWAARNKERDEERETFRTRSESDEFKALTDELRDSELEAYKTTEASFKADCDQREAQIKELDTEIERREDLDRRQREAAEASKGSPSVRINHEPVTYRSDNARGEKGLSYYRDLAMVHGPGISLQTGGTRDQAQERLNQHAKEMEVLLRDRDKQLEQRAQRQVAEAEAEFLSSFKVRDSKVDRLMREMRETGTLPYSPFEQRVTPNSTDGYGGYFLPPIWLVDEFIPGLRAHLIAAGLPRQMDIPPGTNSINIPKLNTLTIVGYQQANNAGLPSQDWTDTFAQANVKTVGGYSDIAVQLLEQSPHGIVDEVITTDMIAAYNKFLDGEVIAGDGTNAATLNGGHLKGIYPYTNWTANNVTYTDASPAPYHMAPGVFGPMASKIARTRFDAENFKVVVHGRRWFYYSTGLDANNRPLGETAAGGPFNIQTALQDGLQAEGLVGHLPYLANAPVYIDDNIGVEDTTGGGSGQDYAIGGLWNDAWLFRSPLRTDVFREVESATLGVRFRLYNYAAFLIRYGQSFAVATGSGFAEPSTGYGDHF
jgi:hypothetical protein